MEQTTSPRDLGLPCTPEQASALYQSLFRHSADLNHMRAVQTGCLPQGQESQGCHPGLELPTVLLEMERRWRAQEQLLWDLELLTGAGLSLFWPPRAQFCRLKDPQTQRGGNQRDKPCGRMGGASPLPVSGASLGASAVEEHGPDAHCEPACPTPHPLSCENRSRQIQDPLLRKEESPRQSPLPPAGDSPHQHHQLRERQQAGGPLAALDLDEAGNHMDASEKSLSPPVGPEPGCPQDPDLPESQAFEGPRSTEDLAQCREQSPAEPQTQKLHGPSSGSLQGQELAQGAKGPPDTPKGLTSSVGQSQREGAPRDPTKRLLQGQKAKAPQGAQGETIEGQRVAAPRGERGNSPKCQEAQRPPSSEGRVLSLPVSGEDGPPGSPPRGSCRSLEEQIPPAGRREMPGPRRKTRSRDSLMAATVLGPHGTWDPQRPPAPRPGGSDPGAAEREADDGRALQTGNPAGLPGALGDRRAAPGARSSKAAWPGPAGSETTAGISEVQRETALQRLQELHRAAWRRRQQDRERQRLWVLDRLRIARNRRSRVHPLWPAPSPAQLPPQEGSAEQRRALREQLQQVQRERTGQLRAVGARNTQNFQELLGTPGAEEPAPGE